MKRIVCKNYEEMSRAGALIMAEQIWSKPDCVLGFSTGSTPVGLYGNLAAMHEDGALDFSRVTTFNLDEYYPMPKANAQSYYTFMHETLFSRLNVDPARVHLPDGGAADAGAACDDYERALAAAGGVDLQLLGIGHNGHIAFNEPADEMPVRTALVSLTEETIEANARFFSNSDEVPRHALSMGMGSILSARRLLMIISGKDKAPAVSRLFSGIITTQFPASLIALHPDVLVLLDEGAAEGL
ncbi:MAG: glucosamine-6-phosphate deaminase [Oscillospiraceae bacterium]|nr:glucosamine-6-phosphate deaminase [Oscillospiraceae bacterium]